MVFLARRHGHGLDPANGKCSLVAPARPRQRSQLRHADLGPRQHPVRFVRVQGRQPRDPAEDRRARPRTPRSCGSPTACGSCSSTPIALGDYVYGTTGDFGPAFLTALNIKTGESAWQHRGFGRASLVYADGKTIIMDEDGDLALARLAPEGVDYPVAGQDLRHHVVDRADAGRGTLYARDREKIVALSVGERRPATSPSRPRRRPSGIALGGRRAPRRSFAGTWRLDPERSRVIDAAGLAGLIGAGAPPMLHITQPPTARLWSRARSTKVTFACTAGQDDDVGRSGRDDHDDLGVGRAGPRQPGNTCRVVGRFDRRQGKLSVSADGNVLTSMSLPQRARSRERAEVHAHQDVGPCETWPTPCKR